MRVSNRLCRECGLIFQSPRPDNTELTAYYARYMAATQPAIAAIPLSFEEHIRAIGRLRLAHLRPFLRNGMRVLDIGCSFGALLAVLRDESGFDLVLTGVNPEASLAQFGIRRWGLDIRIGMFESLRFADAAFDLVIMDNVIEHLADPVASLAEINRITADDGVMLVVTNNARIPHGFYWQNFFLDHTVTFTPETLTALASMSGYAVEAMDNAGHVTWRGYHYPYTTGTFRKVGETRALDRAPLAGHAAAMRRFVAWYTREWSRGDPWRRRLYELSLSEWRLPRLLASVGLGVARRFRRNLEFEMPNHTLPPAEVRSRWVFAAFCASYADGGAALSLASRLAMGAEVYLFRDKENGCGFFTAMAPGSDRPDHLPSMAEALNWVNGSGPMPDIVVAVRLVDATSTPEHWIEAVTGFVRSSRAAVSLGDSHGCWMAAARGDAILDIAGFGAMP